MNGKIQIVNRTDGTTKVIDAAALLKELKSMAKATPDFTDMSKQILDSDIDPEAAYSVLLMFFHNVSQAEARFEEIIKSANGGRNDN